MEHHTPCIACMSAHLLWNIGQCSDLAVTCYLQTVCLAATRYLMEPVCAVQGAPALVEKRVVKLMQESNLKVQSNLMAWNRQRSCYDCAHQQLSLSWASLHFVTLFAFQKQIEAFGRSDNFQALVVEMSVASLPNFCMEVCRYSEHGCCSALA